MYLKPFTTSLSIRHNDAQLYSEDVRRCVENESVFQILVCKN